MTWIWVALGGAIGSVVRFAVSTRLHSGLPGVFPAATLGINLAGSACIGILAAWLEGSSLSPAAAVQARAFLMVGLLGGFTTFSAFSLENVALIRAGEWGQAAFYVLASNVLGIALAFGGWWGMRALLRAG